jgi:hypothetical protein
MTRMSKAREEEIRDAVTSGNENAGRLRLESMCADVLAELDATRADLEALRSDLHRLQALGKHWVTLAGAPPGKYSGPEVLAACDAFHRELSR